MVPPLLEWFGDQEDYFVDEIVGFTQDEIQALKDVSVEALDIFIKATEHIIQYDRLDQIGIPKVLHKVIKHTWAQRSGKHPFLYGRFDISGGVGELPSKVIEFNADTCTMVPETILWQPLQLHHAAKMRSFNLLQRHLTDSFAKIRQTYDDRPVLLGTSLGYEEDQANIKAILDQCVDDDTYFKYYRDLETVTFSDEGVFIEEDDGYIQVDILLKLFPWDWAADDEPGLAELLSDLILEGKVTVLSPPYTAIWQNKRFLNYITTYFPNNVIAKSYESRPPGVDKYVAKSSHGRLGEEVSIVDGVPPKKFKHDVSTYQEFLNLPQDQEGNYYQLSVFVTDTPCALNIRCSEGQIINDDCEFYCHYVV